MIDRSLAYQFLLGLPRSNTLLPIILPTIYLWAVDTWALRRGTWTIESGTKLEWHLWDGLDVEEAVFFLLTNILIVFGLIAFDNAFSIIQAFPELFNQSPAIPSPILLVRGLLVPTQYYDEQRIRGLQEAVHRLRAKSRSFYLASGVFQGRLRIDLVLLYSFCRVADDLVDEASDPDEARKWIQKLRKYLDLKYEHDHTHQYQLVAEYIQSEFPTTAQATLHLLPTGYLSPGPLYDLLEGFETDVSFRSSADPFPIHTEAILELYGAQVAGTVAEACLELVYVHTAHSTPHPERERILQAGRMMGMALQYVNIARDITVDAGNDRVYIPNSWLKEVNLSARDILERTCWPEVEKLRHRLLDKAMLVYDEAKQAIEELPADSRAPMRVAVESYVEIGRTLRTPGYRIKAGRATVPKFRRLQVAWRALQKG